MWSPRFAYGGTESGDKICHLQNAVVSRLVRGAVQRFQKRIDLALGNTLRTCIHAREQRYSPKGRLRRSSFPVVAAVRRSWQFDPVRFRIGQPLLIFGEQESYSLAQSYRASASPRNCKSAPRRTRSTIPGSLPEPPYRGGRLKGCRFSGRSGATDIPPVFGRTRPPMTGMSTWRRASSVRAAGRSTDLRRNPQRMAL